MATFTADTTITARWATDHTHRSRYHIVKRTPKTLTIRDESGQTRRVKIHIHDGDEYVLPEGTFSMAPVAHPA